MVADVIGLLDHIGADQAVIGGLSLGANCALATAQSHPERVKAMILEMPVLLRGHRVGRPAFTTMARAFRTGRPALGPAAAVLRRVPLPRRLPELAAARDVIGADPRVASAVLTGLLSEAALPEDPQSLAALHMPTLVIGHHGDPLHTFADARDLAHGLPNGRLVETRTILDHRFAPARLARHINEFLAEADG
jgi:pimeloyl-ACP methyl ester carboxylesterase